METNIFKTIEEVFKLKTKSDIDDYLNKEIDEFVGFFKEKGYIINSQTGFDAAYFIPLHREDTINEKLALYQLFFIRKGLKGNWDIISTDNENIQYYERIKGVFQTLYDTATSI